MAAGIAVYREFAPHAALRPYVRALFSFLPGADDEAPSRQRACEVLTFSADVVCPPILADGHACLSFRLGSVCHADGRWRAAPATCVGHIGGAVTHADGSAFERPSMVGAYFRAGGLAAFTSIPLHELTNRAVRVEEMWGAGATSIAGRLAELAGAARIDALETLLVERIGSPARTQHASVDVGALAASIEQRAGRVSVEQLTRAAGVSRQHLTRTFRECVGIPPKLYARLARFQASLAYADAVASEEGGHAAGTRLR
jgi:hypothetical protein